MVRTADGFTRRWTGAGQAACRATVQPSVMVGACQWHALLVGGRGVSMQSRIPCVPPVGGPARSDSWVFEPNER